MVSVLFVDLVGFTALSEGREAEDVRELLGRYFDSARTIVDRYGGVIEKFIGDAVMAVWGVPVAREDDAERAVRAALEVVDAVSVFGAEVGAVDLRARAGVVTGQVAALDNPGQGLVVGDRVNTASRVQSAAQPGSVFVDEVTRQVTMAAIAYEDAGEHSVKGKAEPLRLWRAVRVVAGMGGEQRESGLEAPFVGREGDLRLLKELFHGALERRSARLVAVTADAGLGKSRLRREFFNYVDGLAETLLWHTGRCLSYGEGVAYWALAEMVRQRLGIAENASPEDAAAKLESGLARWVPDESDREFIAPRLGALLGLADPGAGREELFSGWRMFFERLADHEPVALVFEDLQWADDGLLDFIEQLLDWSAASPIFILTLGRPEFAAGRDGWPAGRRSATLLVLEPLADGSMRELLDGLVDGLPAEAARRIISQAQGVPLFAVETVRALADRGALVERDGRLFLEGELGELDVPPSLSSLLAARLDALEGAERNLVKAMSLFGGSFPRSAAAALGDVPEDELDEVLNSLVRKQVLVIRADKLSPDRGQYAIAQELLRAVAYEMLSRQERRLRHQAAAEHLRSAFANDGEEVAEAISSHYLDAYRAAQGDPDADELRAEALSALRRAAHRALTVGAPETAERLYLTAAGLATEEPDEIALVQAAGEAALRSGRLEAAVESLEKAFAAHSVAGRTREASRGARHLGLALMRLGRAEEGAERIALALDALDADDASAEVGELNLGLARALRAMGKNERCASALETALAIAEALKLPEVLTQGLTSKANLYQYGGRNQEGHHLATAALEIARAHSLIEAECRAATTCGVSAMQWDRPEAGEHFSLAASIARRLGDRYSESLNAGNLMTVHLYAGRWDELERVADDLLTGNEDRPGAEDLQYRRVFLHALRGNGDGARASLERMEPWKHSDELEVHGLYASAVIAERLVEGDYEQALSYGLAGLPRHIETLSVANESVRYEWPDTLDAALALGRLADVRKVLALLTDQPPGFIPPYLDAQLARGRALLASAEARHDHVRDGLLTAIDAFRGLGYPYWLAVAQLDLAEWLIGQSRGEEAAALVEEAIGVLEPLRAGPALARARGLIETPAQGAEIHA
jgi:class 3 adenylate cyclase/predicted ATPase